METNTFNANAISQKDYGLDKLAYEINLEASKIAKSTAALFSDKPRFVAGALGPTNQTASLSPDVNNPGFRNISFDELKYAYYDQASGLLANQAYATVFQLFLILHEPEYWVFPWALRPPSPSLKGRNHGSYVSC